jgi:serine/threonine protein phosphatase PrpC
MSFLRLASVISFSFSPNLTLFSCLFVLSFILKTRGMSPASAVSSTSAIAGTQSNGSSSESLKRTKSDGNLSKPWEKLSLLGSSRASGMSNPAMDEHPRHSSGNDITSPSYDSATTSQNFHFSSSSSSSSLSSSSSSSSSSRTTKPSWRAKIFGGSRIATTTTSISSGPYIPPMATMPLTIPFSKYDMEESSINGLYQTLPKLRLPSGGFRPFNPSSSITLFSPENNLWEYGFTLGEEIACGSVSTYPPKLGKKEREGDPIADRFVVQVQDSGSLVVISLADGCNWGSAAKEAASIASKTFVNYINAHQHLICDMQSAGYHLINAFSVAHENICEARPDLEKCGTTTLFGCIIFPLGGERGGNGSNSDKWALISAAVGDCKVYHYSSSSHKVKDITEGSRENITNGSDPGGRLGPTQKPEGLPDLRNLRLYSQVCKKNDLLLFCTDGVADNLDPRHLGFTPRDVHLDHDTWSEKGDQAENDAQTKFTEQNLRDNFILTSSSTHSSPVYSTTSPTLGTASGKGKPSSLPTKDILSKILQHCLSLTHKSREWMITNPNRRLPRDYKQFPGKMDHATAVLFKLQSTKRPAIISAASSIPIFRQKEVSSASPNDVSSPSSPSPGEETLTLTPVRQIGVQHYHSSYVHAFPEILPGFRSEKTGLSLPLPAWVLQTLAGVSESNSENIELLPDNFEDGSQVSLGSFVSSALLTTFPHLPNKVKREGSPICDRFFIQCLKNQPAIFFGLADSSSWGKAATIAAELTIASFKERLNSILPPSSSPLDVQKITQPLLETVHFISQQIKAGSGKHDILEAETIAFTGGVLLPLEKREVTYGGNINAPQNQTFESTSSAISSSSSTASFSSIASCSSSTSPSSSSSSSSSSTSPTAASLETSSWAVIFTNVGSNRFYHYSATANRVKDVTSSVCLTFENLARLGPVTKPLGEPDLRNLSLHSFTAGENDLLLIFSDGIVDNLHPQYYGFSPSHFNLPSSPPSTPTSPGSPGGSRGGGSGGEDDWSVDISNPVEKDAVTAFTEGFLEKLIHGQPLVFSPPPCYGRKVDIRPFPAAFKPTSSSATSSPTSPTTSTSSAPTLTSQNGEGGGGSTLFFPLNGEEVVERLVNHVLELTKAGRGFFAGVHKQLPKNHTAITGKMGHAAVIVLQLPSVGGYVKQVIDTTLQRVNLVVPQ